MNKLSSIFQAELDEPFSTVVGFLLLSMLVLSITGCGKPNAETKTPPAKVENPVKETELSTITLTPEAEERIKLKIEKVVLQPVKQTREYNGEVVLPPDSLFNVTAPIAGTLISQTATPDYGTFVRKGQIIYKIQQIITPAEREQRAVLERDTEIAETTANNEIQTAQTRVEAAKVRLNRAEQLVRVGGGSIKAAEAVREELRLAEIAVQTARQRAAEMSKPLPPVNIPVEVKAPRDGIVQKLHVSAGQTVTGGTMLFEAANFSSVLIRVPVYVGELNTIARNASARIHNLNDLSGQNGVYARPTSAPPSADPNAATADLYYILPNPGSELRPGQRVGVTLAGGTEAGDRLVVPRAAILYDINGGAWVYEVVSEHKYLRRRVTVSRIIDDLAVIESGPAAGASIVTEGASELFGTEFGGGK